MFMCLMRMRWQMYNLSLKLSQQFKSNYEKDSGRYHYSAIFFNSWNFKTDNKIDFISLRDGIYNRIFTEFEEEKLKKIIFKRKKSEWRMLYLRRIILMTFNICFIIGCSTSIILVNIKKRELESWVDETSTRISFLTQDYAK